MCMLWLPDSPHLPSLEDLLDSKVSICLGVKQVHYPSFISEASYCLALCKFLGPDPH